MTKQEQIEEMVSIMAASNNPFIDVPIEIMPQVAKALYNAGYRKSEEVRKETAKEIFKSFENAFSLYYPHGILTYEDFQNHFMYLAKQYGVEVEE